MKTVTAHIKRHPMAAISNKLAKLVIASLMFIGFMVGAYQRPAKAFNQTSSVAEPTATPQDGAANHGQKSDTSSQVIAEVGSRNYTIASKDRPPTSLPRYNEVFRKATHNSYWVNGARDRIDAYAAGPQQRVTDQAFREHARGFEFDIHYKSGHPGEFDIYHTDSQDNSTT